MTKEKKSLLVLLALKLLYIVSVILWVITLFGLHKIVHFSMLILVQVLSIYVNYKVKLHKKKYMKSDKIEKCCREEK